MRRRTSGASRATAVRTASSWSPQRSSTSLMRSSTLISHCGSATWPARPVASKAQSRVRSSAAWLRRESSRACSSASEQLVSASRHRISTAWSMAPRVRAQASARSRYHSAGPRACSAAVAARHLRQCQAHLQRLLVALGQVQCGRGLAQRACAPGCAAWPGLRASGRASVLACRCRGGSSCVLGCGVAPVEMPQPCYACATARRVPRVRGRRSGASA